MLNYRGVMHLAVLCCGLFLFALIPCSCSMIDEDQSDCEKSKIDYELRLITNISTEIETQLETETTLSTEANLELAQALRDHLSGIFTDFAHDVDLSFYDTVGDSLRLQHDEHIMDANQASYSLNLPMRRYMHLATANILDNQLVTLENDERCHRSTLQQTRRDTIDSHETGIFTARQPMEILEGIDQYFNVHLYMANCAAMLIIDPKGQDTNGIRVYSTGFATDFNICDSLFVYPENSPIVRTSQLKVNGESGPVGFCSVTFPSRDTRHTRTVIETEEPFIAEPGEESLWEFRVYVPHQESNNTRSEEKVTETVLRIKEPLRAGQLKIIKCWVGSNGEVHPLNPEIGTSVTLDWKPGLEIET